MFGAAIGMAMALTNASLLDPIDFNTQIDRISKPFQTLAQKEIEKLTAGASIPGLTVAVVFDGGLVAAFGQGVRKQGSDEPILPTDPMHVGSNTKGMTALAFARLVDKNKLSFDATLGQTFGDAIPNMCPAYRSVPLLELMHHRSGIVQTDPENWNFQADKSNPRLALAKYALTHEPPTVPGSKFEYRNGNFVMLGEAMEAATGLTWEQIMQDQVFGPLHMKTAGFGPMGDGTDVSVPWQHVMKESVPAPVYHDNPPMLGPAGTVHCSAIDFANYAFAHVQGDYGAGWYLSPKNWKVLHTPFPGGQYAGGIFSINPGPNGCHDMSHRGSNTMSCSEWRTAFDGRIVLVVMMNVNTELIGRVCDGLTDLAARFGGLK